MSKSYLVVREEDVYEEKIIHRSVICTIERFNSFSDAVDFIRKSRHGDYYIIEKFTVD